MGKKNKSNSLGRSLIKDRFAKKGYKTNDSLIHTSELNDGYDWARLNLNSVTEQNSFEEFLSTAQLAGTEFQAEKLNVKIVNPVIQGGVLTPDERKKFEKDKQDKNHLIRIPRRPKWDANTTAEVLQAAEIDSFLSWRRSLALLQEEEGVILTPYEKNLDFWRQLWRVVERSDVIVQILDARNPLLFRCEDLEKYVQEVDKRKINFLLVNKADYLSKFQREEWIKYFKKEGIRAAFFSATQAAESCKSTLYSIDENETGPDARSDESEGEGAVGVQEPALSESEHDGDDDDDVDDDDSENWKDCDESSEDEMVDAEEIIIPENLLGVEELLDLFESLTKLVPGTGTRTVGLVGYPNVGKSSTINALMGNKKVSVSATPGKTKHFQTLIVREGLVLCDCPGLVMPSMVATKAEMLLNGILSVDQMRDYIPPISHLLDLLPKELFEREYGILILSPPDSDPLPHHLLNAYAYSRGFMTANGQPDMSRAARLILKDFVKGKLLHCTSPPGVDQKEFQNQGIWRSEKWLKDKPVAKATPHQTRTVSDGTITGEEIDSKFFNKLSLGAHSKGRAMVASGESNSVNPSPSSDPNKSKPWKDHSYKRNKREKLRRVYRHLDEQ